MSDETKRAIENSQETIRPAGSEEDELADRDLEAVAGGDSTEPHCTLVNTVACGCCTPTWELTCPGKCGG